MRLREISVAVFLTLTPVAWAGDVIVSREGDAMAVYFKVPMAEVPGLFGREVAGIVREDGAGFDNISQGTFAAAELLASDVTFLSGDDADAFDALSMMVHPV